MKTKIKELIMSVLALPKKLLIGILRKVFGVINVFMHSTLFVIATLAIGLIVGFGVGARMFETGIIASKFGGSLKGTNAKVSGPCRVSGVVRDPALMEDQVKIVSVDDSLLIGIVRATRETVECDLATTSIDTLPLLKDIATSPVEAPEIKPFEVSKVDTELEQLRKRTIRVSGTCEDSQGQELAALIDQNIDVINVERTAADKEVIRIHGIMRKTKATVTCLSKNIRYSILDNNGEVSLVAGQSVQQKKDLVGDVILITSTCFPDKRLPSTKKSKILFYPTVNAKLQVTQNTFDEDGKLIYVAGAIVDNGAMVECDASKYPISWRPFDPGTMKLENIKGSSAPDESAGQGQGVPAE